MRAVALKITLQCAGVQYARQFVVGQREVIHADVDVAYITHTLDYTFEDRETHGQLGQRVFVDLALHLEKRGHVHIAEDRDAVRPHADDRIERAREAFDALIRQAVDQIDAHRFEAVLTCGMKHGFHHRARLDAVDRALHAFVEILHAEAQPIEAEFAQQRDRLRRCLARIDLDRIFGAFVGDEREVFCCRGHQFAHFTVREEGRRVAAPVKLSDGARGIDECGLHGKFVLHAIEIGPRVGAVLRRDLVAAAVEANRVAERDVEVERQVGIQRTLIRRAMVMRGIESVGELDGGRIGRLARTVGVIAFEQVRAEQGGSVSHDGASGRNWASALSVESSRACSLRNNAAAI